MTGSFLDSNVLLYTLAQGDPRAAVASELLVRGGTVSVQVLNEFANVAHRKLGLPWAEVALALASLRVLCAAPLPLTLATHEAALALAERHRFSFYDALIVASALEARCAALMSEDMQHDLLVNGVLTIQNPFKAV